MRAVFWGLVPDRPVGACWEWRGKKDGRARKGGYGIWNNRVAHRVAYELLIGPVPEGLELDHLCRNHGCVNPDHLEPVTHQENMRRSPIWRANIRRLQTECIHGHPFTEANTRYVVRGTVTMRHCRECNRIYQRERYRTDPVHRERAKARARAWDRAQHAARTAGQPAMSPELD